MNQTGNDETALLDARQLDRIAGVTLNLLMELAALSERVHKLESKSAPDGSAAGDMQARLDDLIARVLAASADPKP